MSVICRVCSDSVSKLLLKSRRGHGVSLEQHKHVIAFSKERMLDDWITFDKENMHSTLGNSLDSDSPAQLSTRVEAHEEEVSERDKNLQHGSGTAWADRLHASAIIPQDQPKIQPGVPNTENGHPADGHCRQSHLGSFSHIHFWIRKVASVTHKAACVSALT